MLITKVMIKTVNKIVVVLVFFCSFAILSCTDYTLQDIDRSLAMGAVENEMSIKNWSLSVSTSKSTYKVCEPVIITVVLENISGEQQPYGIQDKDMDFILDCRNDRDEKMPFTLFGKRMIENRGIGRYIQGELEAGEKLTNKINLTQHVDLSLPDRYVLKVSREIFPHKGSPMPPVVSNKISFEVIVE